MKIKNVKYIDKNNDGVIITFKDDTTFQLPTQKYRYQYTGSLNEWLENGGKIRSWKSQKELEEEVKKQIVLEAKQQKEKDLSELKVSLNNVSYDAHTEGIGNMGIVIGGMTYKFCKAMAEQSPELQALYDDIFKQDIQWKGADNKLHRVQIQSIAQTLEKAMDEKAKILYKY